MKDLFVSPWKADSVRSEPNGGASTPPQQHEFGELFADLLRDAYIADIDSYKGEKVIYKRETQEQQFAVVQTILRSPEGTDRRLPATFSWRRVESLRCRHRKCQCRKQLSLSVCQSDPQVVLRGFILALKEKTLSSRN